MLKKQNIIKNQFPSLVKKKKKKNLCPVILTDVPNCRLICVPASLRQTKGPWDVWGFLCSTCRGGLQGASCRRRAGSTSHSGAGHQHEAVLGVRPQTCGAQTQQGSMWRRGEEEKHKQNKKKNPEKHKEKKTFKLDRKITAANKMTKIISPL